MDNILPLYNKVLKCYYLVDTYPESACLTTFGGGDVLKSIFTRIRNMFSRLSITSQIAIFCFLLFIFTFFLSSIFNQEIFRNISLEQASGTISQTLLLVEENIDSVINSINETSKSILSNEQVRDYMSSSGISGDVGELSEVRTFIRNILDNVSYATSVHLFNKAGDVMNISIRMVNYPVSDDITDAHWYSRVNKKAGDFCLINNGGGFFERTSNHDFISMVRLFNDIETLECNGVQITNFSTETIKTAFQDLLDEYGTQVIIFDEYGHRITATDMYLKTADIIGGKELLENDYVIKTVDGADYMISTRTNSYGWRIIAMMPMAGISGELYGFSFITLIFILVNGLLMFLGVSVISRLVTQPINQLVTTMEKVKGGQLEPAGMRTSNREIATLKEGYNVMVDEIHELISKVVEEQEMIRKSELKLLQSQIKPHFLYNTFDAISSLALMNKNREVYEAMLALGSLYRTNLSSGNEVIRISDEVEAVRNYIKILKIRYDDVFTANIHVDERACPMLIPKLTLQPIIENALYHGIKPKGEPGNIDVNIAVEGEELVIKIRDDGVGMHPGMADKLLKGGSGSFGLRGTIERLRIYYMRQDVVAIQSVPGKGTSVIIRVPAVMEEMEHDNGN